VLDIAAPKIKMHFPLGDIAFWMVAMIATLFAFIPPLAPEGVLLAGAAGGSSAFLQAGVQQMSFALAPNPATGASTFISSAEQLGNYTASFGESARKGLEQWVNGTMAGRKDENGTSIV
jgi:hypothetical protein